MSEASQLESMLQGAEKESFDLVNVVSGCVDGYRLAYADKQFSLETSDGPIILIGLPDTFAQLLDKLVQNAIDFATAGTPIGISVSSTTNFVTLSVINEGPCLTPAVSASLFSSMVSSRIEGAETHLGLGLYIVRVIAEFHGGGVSAKNLPDKSGVQITVQVPVAS